MMSRVAALVAREWNSYLSSPIAYVLATLFLAISGYLFAIILLESRQATLRFLLLNVNFLLLLMAPMLTMRLLAEERRTGTVELLLTLPFRDMEVVLGKFLASLLLFLAIILPVVWYAIVLVIVAGTAPEAGPLASGLLGVALQAAVFVAVGLFASSLTSNQIVAAVLAFAFTLALWLLSSLTAVLGPGSTQLVNFLSLPNQFSQFARGIIDVRAVIYHLSLTTVFLFLTYTVLQTRRWL